MFGLVTRLDPKLAQQLSLVTGESGISGICSIEMRCNMLGVAIFASIIRTLRSSNHAWAYDSP